MDPESSEGFLHFLLRIRRGAGASAGSDLSGQVERLGTGEKRGFGNWEELQRLVRGWSASGGGPGADSMVDSSIVEGRAPVSNTVVPPP
ncbi:MAG TPA: hypothetical protein VFL93_08285 [Longimicrobiaceae bacterium]|nr:hypothetical protein [Longimicrobiaceae bacterium]